METDTTQDKIVVDINSDTRSISKFESYFTPVDISTNSPGKTIVLSVNNNPLSEMYIKNEFHSKNKLNWIQSQTFNSKLALIEQKYFNYFKEEGWIISRQIAYMGNSVEGIIIKENVFPRNETDTAVHVFEVPGKDSISSRLSFSRFFQAYEKINIQGIEYNSMQIKEVATATIINYKTKETRQNENETKKWYVKGLGLVKIELEKSEKNPKGFIYNTSKVMNQEDWNKISPKGLGF
jgi:hypothetical protein